MFSDSKKPKSILCFGNPLVDSYLLVEEGFLEKYGIRKGEMAIYDDLVPPENINNMRKDYQFTDFEAGGSSINTIKGYSIIGGIAGVVCSYGDDERGKLFSKEFKRLGIRDYSVIDPSSPTSYLMIMVTPDANRTVVGSFYPSYHLNSEKVDYGIISEYDYVFVESYSFTDDPKYDAVFKTLENIEKYGKKMIFALSNMNCVLNYTSLVLKFAFHKNCKVIIGNDSEYLALFPNLKTIEEVVDHVVSYNKSHDQWELVLITNGPKGAWIIMGTEVKFIDSPDVEKVVDTTGAGDYFAAGVFYAILNGYGYEAAGVLGGILAGDIISRVGVKLSEEAADKARKYISSINL